MLSYERLKKRPPELLAATGLTEPEYEQLLTAFESAHAKQYPPEHTLEGKVRQRRTGAGTKGQLSDFSDKLLFILIYVKTHPLQTLHGLSFNLSQGQTNYWIHHLLPVLQESLRALGHAPERSAAQVGANDLVRDGGAHLLLDGTERRRQRPQDKARQKEHYSGKKKAHTDKNLLLVHEHSGKVVYLSETVAGKKHDKKMADEAAIVYPAGATLAKDTGFQGYEPEGILTAQPKKSLQARN